MSRLILDSSNPPENGSVIWRSPSNIALIKYWGKHGIQLPKNPSLSLTLASSCTDTQLEYEMKDGTNDGQIELDFFFHESENEPFRQKILTFLNSLSPEMPFLKQLKFTLKTGNSFPHSAGIASSASSMSALALCLCSLEDRFFGTLQDADDFDRKHARAQKGHVHEFGCCGCAAGWGRVAGRVLRGSDMAATGPSCQTDLPAEREWLLVAPDGPDRACHRSGFCRPFAGRVHHGGR